MCDDDDDDDNDYFFFFRQSGQYHLDDLGNALSFKHSKWNH